jgi:hypothetical protein
MTGSTLSINRAPTFLGEVPFHPPGAKSNSLIELDLKWLSTDEANEFVDKYKDASDFDVFKGIVAGWHNVDGEFNDDNIKALLANYYGITSAIVQYWRKELNVARLKN